MSSTYRADEERSPISAQRRAVASLVRAPSIPPRRKDSIQTEIKRAAVVLRRGMKQTEFRHVEEQLDLYNLTCLPVLAGQRRMTVSDTPVCGFIVTGGDMDPSHAERDLIMTSVRETMDRGVPVLAMSEAVPLVLEAAGVEGAVAEGCAVLLQDAGVRVLEKGAAINDAIKLMAKGAAR
jgi:hypothetical protein